MVDPLRSVKLTCAEKAFIETRSDARIVRILHMVPAASQEGTACRGKLNDLTSAIISGDTKKQQDLFRWFTENYPVLKSA